MAGEPVTAVPQRISPASLGVAGVVGRPTRRALRVTRKERISARLIPLGNLPTMPRGNMIREMRRKKQALSRDDCLAVLGRATSGVLALAAEEYPYAVPLSFVVHGESLFFHCAPHGHKLDALAANNRVSFCVIDADRIVSEEFTTYFRSVIVFGTAGIVRDPQRKRLALESLAARYSPNQTPDREIDRLWDKTCVVELAIERMTGKEAIELRRRRRGDHGN